MLVVLSSLMPRRMMSEDQVRRAGWSERWGIMMRKTTLSVGKLVIQIEFMLSLKVRANNVDKLQVVKLFPIWVIFLHFQCVRVYNTR